MTKTNEYSKSQEPNDHKKPSVSRLAERKGGRVFFNPNFVIVSYIQAVRQMFPDEQLAKKSVT